MGHLMLQKFLLAFPPTEVEHIAILRASAAEGKHKKKTYVPLAANPIELPDTPNGAKMVSIPLLNPLKSGQKALLEVLYVITHSVEPFPAERCQSESQYVHFRYSALLLSPYHIAQQITLIKTPNNKVESFTRVDPTHRAGVEIKYGYYHDHPPYTFSPIIVHFENNNPFAVVEELVRVVDVSH